MYLSRTEKEAALWNMMKTPGFRDLPVSVLWKLRGMLRHEKFVRLNGRVVINSFLPPFPSRAFDRLGEGITGLRGGDPAPVSAYVAVTDRCRYHCWHCSKAHRGGREMSRETLAGVIGEIQQLGVSVVGLTGGEPLLRGDLVDIVRSVDDRSATIVFTSGDGATEATARGLREAGLFGAAVSLDHYDPRIHDQRRGIEGAFESAVNAVRVFREQGLYTMIQLVATKDMAADGGLDPYLDLAARLGAHEIRLLEPMPCGRLTTAGAEILLTATERQGLRRLHMRAAKSAVLPKVCSFAHIEHESLYGCGAGFQHLYVDAFGNVCPCDFTPISFGNVNDESLEIIWRRLREAFPRPGCSCFLMRNAERLKDLFAGELPLRYSDVSDRCDFCDETRVPEYYRILGCKI